MRLAATLGASLARILEQEVRAGERAVTRAVRAETERLKQEVRQQTIGAFGVRGRGLAGAWRSRVFPTQGESLGTAGIVWTKAPTIVDAFERGATIRARGSRFLAIPTGFNAPQGRRGRGMRVTPQQMAATKQAFLRPFKDGRGFVWCLPVRLGSHRGDAAMGSRQGERVGRRRAPLIAGGLVAVATRRLKAAARAAWQRELLEQGFVPMFLLLPEVRLAKRLDARAAGARALARLPQAVVREWRTSG
jgi:hypothetical protein